MTLRRRLGLWQTSLTGVGVILGAGIYALIGPAAALAGQALWLAFVLGGVAAGLTAYSYARLGAVRPKASPEFQYTALAFGPEVGFIAGWLMLIGDVAAAASVALGFGGYFGHLVGTPVVAGALGLVVVAAVAMYLGIGQSIAIAAILTVVEVAGLLIVIAVGLPAWRMSTFQVDPGQLNGVLGAAALIFFAYLGFDELGNLAEEMHAPERDLPRALYIALGVTTMIYVAVSLSATAVVSARALGESSAPLALVVGAVWGRAADWTLTIMALAATANTVLLLLLAAARSVYGMAGAGVLPKRLARLTSTDVPREATLVVLLVTMAVAAAGDLSAVARLTDAMVLLSFLCVNASLAWLAVSGRLSRARAPRARDVALSGGGALMCAGLLWHGGWPWIVAALAAGAVGGILLVGGRAAAARELTR